MGSSGRKEGRDREMVAGGGRVERALGAGGSAWEG